MSVHGTGMPNLSETLKPLFVILEVPAMRHSGNSPCFRAENVGDGGSENTTQADSRVDMALNEQVY